MDVSISSTGGGSILKRSMILSDTHCANKAFDSDGHHIITPAMTKIRSSGRALTRVCEMPPPAVRDGAFHE